MTLGKIGTFFYVLISIFYNALFAMAIFVRSLDKELTHWVRLYSLAIYIPLVIIYLLKKEKSVYLIPCILANAIMIFFAAITCYYNLYVFGSED
jgi:hypothetical protein